MSSRDASISKRWPLWAASLALTLSAPLACGPPTVEDEPDAGDDTSIRTRADAGPDDADTGLDAAMGDAAPDAGDTAPPPPPALESSTVTVGNGHSCAITGERNRIVCWGRNDTGQLGVGATTPRQSFEPLAVTDTMMVRNADWGAVSAGDGYTCGLRVTGEALSEGAELWCWGTKNPYVTQEPAPRQVQSWDQDEPGDNWLKVSAGPEHTCAIKKSGTLYCWAEKAGEPQVGARRERANPEFPVPVGESDDWRSVSAGGEHTCAIRNDDTLWCWGVNDDGQLGNKTDGMQSEKALQIDGAWRSVAAGASHTCAIKDNGSLWCWGRNNEGQRGDGGAGGNPTTPRQIGTFSDWKDLRANGHTTCAARTGGVLFCWGDNDDGQLGDGTRQPRNEPARVAPDQQLAWEDVAVSGRHACGVTVEGETHCWGYNAFGQLGHLKSIYTEPTSIDGSRSWSRISAGEHMTCGMAGGEIYCWGTNQNGQLAVKPLQDRDEPTRVEALADVGRGNWSDVQVGKQHACALDGTGGLFCWGSNQFGQIGNGEGGGQQWITEPTEVGADTGWEAIALGPEHTCALDVGGTLYCWGNNAGRLGNDSFRPQKSPVEIDEGPWTDIAGGGTHTCGLKDDGTLWCWGSNSHGQIAGFRDVNFEKTPSRVGDQDDWIGVAAGQLHACALKSDGTIWCWGSNQYGQVGRGETGLDENDEPEQTSKPTRVGEKGATFKRVFAARHHSCGIRQDGSTQCWGLNEDGQIGNGRFGDGQIVAEPADIASDASWQSVAPGADHTCAIRSSTSLWCWGSNSHGQLGNSGVRIPQPVPVYAP